MESLYQICVRHARHFGVALAVALAGCTPGADSTDTPRSPTGEEIPDGEAAIEPGTYRIPSSAWSLVDLTVTFPRGWTVQYGHVFLKHADRPNELSFYPVVVDGVYTDACKGEGDLRKVGPSVEHLAEALLRQPGPKANGPIETTLGGYPATRVDLTIPKGLDLKRCRFGDIGLQIWYSAPADKYFVLLPDGNASAYIVEVNGKRQVFLAQHRSAASDEDARELQTILDSIRIES